MDVRGGTVVLREVHASQSHSGPSKAQEPLRNLMFSHPAAEKDPLTISLSWLCAVPVVNPKFRDITGIPCSPRRFIPSREILHLSTSNSHTPFFL